MSTELEQRLRDDMDHFTRDLTLPAGFAARVYRRGRARRRTARVLVAGGLTIALAGGAAAVVALSGGPRPANGQRIETAAYVFPKVRQALADAESKNTIVYVRRSNPVPLAFQPGKRGVNIHPSRVDPKDTASYETSSSYGNRSKFSAFDHAGRPLFSELVTTGKGAQTAATVIYSSGTWWRETTPTLPRIKAPTACETRLANGPGGDWPGYIRTGLSCDIFKLEGREVVDGTNAIKLTTDGRGIIDNLWVDPVTYLPVRITIRYGTMSLREDFKWLSPTPANRALLDLPVPAGFKQVTPPPY